VVSFEIQHERLIGQGERISPRGGNLTVSWYSGGNPVGYAPVGDGIVYLYVGMDLNRKGIRDARPTVIDNRYSWRDNSKGDGLMFAISLPGGYTLVDPDPFPVEAKALRDRIALFWFFDGGERHQINASWTLRTQTGDPVAEAERLNREIRLAKKRVSATGPPLRYDVALSFAGEDRAYVEQVASALRGVGVKVFYDGYEQADLWGKDLFVHLQDVYQRQARYTVIFVSKHYASKNWTKFEQQSAQARAVAENREYILPARFDSTVLPGLPEGRAYVSLVDMSPEQLASLIVTKVQST
jgi:hypothetical protein